MFPLLKTDKLSLDTLAYHKRYPDIDPAENPYTRLMEFFMRGTLKFKICTKEDMEDFIFRILYLFPELDMYYHQRQFQLLFDFDYLRFFRLEDFIAHQGMRMHDEQLYTQEQFLQPYRALLRNNAVVKGILNGMMPAFDFIEESPDKEKGTVYSIPPLPEPEYHDIKRWQQEAKYLLFEGICNGINIDYGNL